MIMLLSILILKKVFYHVQRILQTERLKESVSPILLTLFKIMSGKIIKTLNNMNLFF